MTQEDRLTAVEDRLDKLESMVADGIAQGKTMLDKLRSDPMIGQFIKRFAPKL